MDAMTISPFSHTTCSNTQHCLFVLQTIHDDLCELMCTNILYIYIHVLRDEKKTIVYYNICVISEYVYGRFDPNE